MKLFGCKRDGGYSGGLILVAANTKEEAFLTWDDAISYMKKALNQYNL